VAFNVVSLPSRHTLSETLSREQPRRRADDNCPASTDRISVELEDDIANLQTRLSCGAVGFDLGDESTIGRLHLERVGQRLVESLHFDAQPRVATLPVLTI